MTQEDLRRHFWHAGASSKNTPEARAAGVVGTFGIGAMANFGIANELTVVTESAITGERTKTAAQRATLSTKEDCIELVSEETKGNPGTLIIVKIMDTHRIDVAKATRYIEEFTAYLTVPVTVNGTLVSQRSTDEAVAQLAPSWGLSQIQQAISNRLIADIDLSGSSVGEVRITLDSIRLNDELLVGKILLRQGQNSLRTYRSGFGLATVSVSSA